LADPNTDVATTDADIDQEAQRAFDAAVAHLSGTVQSGIAQPGATAATAPSTPAAEPAATDSGSGPAADATDQSRPAADAGTTPAEAQPGGDTTGQTPPTDAAPAKADGAADPAPKPPAAAPASFDWASATEDERRAAFERATTDQKRFQNMVKPLQQRLNNLERQLRERPADAGATATTAADKPAAGPEAMFETPEWKAFETDYPEAAKPQRAAMEALFAQNKALGTKVETLVTERQTAAAVELETYLLDQHPDFYAVGQSREFAQWVETRPVYERQFYERLKGGIGPDDADGALALVTAYKQSLAGSAQPPATAAAPAAGAAQSDNRPAIPTDPKRQRQLETAAAPRTSIPGRVSLEPPPDDPDKIFAWGVDKVRQRFPQFAR